MQKTTTVIDGLEYMRISDGERPTPWLLQSIDEETSSDEATKDLVRCPACKSRRFGYDDGIDWGAIYCRDCSEEFFGLTPSILANHLGVSDDLIYALIVNTCSHDRCWDFYNPEGKMVGRGDPDFLPSIARCEDCGFYRSATIADKICEFGEDEEEVLKAGGIEMAKSIEEQTVVIPMYSLPDGSRIWKFVYEGECYWSRIWIPEAKR